MGVMVIKVTEDNNLVATNISYGNGRVLSVINIDKDLIALCKENGV